MSHYFYITPEEYAKAEQNGVSAKNLEVRVRKLGWDKQRAINTTVSTPIDRSEWKVVAEKNGIPYSTFINRINCLGWAEEKAATKPRKKVNRSEKQVNWIKNRVVPKEYRELASDNGITYQTLRARVRLGWDLKTAATKPTGKYQKGG